MYTKRRLEQIDQYREAARQVMWKYQKFKEWGDLEMANHCLDMKTTLHKMAACLERRERRQQAALEALAKARVDEGAF